jgi:ABC-type transport system involved in multi-copper enzyme maturation permease subunit
MGLLRAELTKLRRPLTWWIAVTAVLASLAFAWQGAKNASAAARPSASAVPRPPTCQDFALPSGALCDDAVSVQVQIDTYHRQQAGAKPSTRHNGRPSDALPVEQPLGAGKIALGFMASLGGAMLVLLLAAGHVGNEWDHRTIKTVLCQDGTRWRTLAAKVTSLWVAAVAILVLDWMVLAVASPILKADYPLSHPGLSWSAAWSSVAADAARAPLIIAAFAVLGVAASVIVRNALAAFALAAGIVVGSLAAAGNFPTVAPWTLAYWVSGWMQYRSHGYVIFHFWVDGYPASVRPPGVLAGSIGLLGEIAVVATSAVVVFRRADITA